MKKKEIITFRVWENLLSKKYDDCFKKMVQSFSEKNDNKNAKYYAFYPSFGVKKKPDCRFPNLRTSS